MSSHPEIVVRKEVDLITVNSGETLTVYLRTTKSPEGYKVVQIEMRVTDAGNPQIYCDAIKTNKSFDNWYSIESD